MGTHAQSSAMATGAIPVSHEHKPVLVVLDLMLPGRDGLDLRSF